MRRNWFLIPLLFFLVIAILFWRSLGLPSGDLPSALIGKPMPTFNLPEVEQPRKVYDTRIFLGHVTVLNVWASWCFTCRAEHPMLLSLKDNPTFQLIGLNYKDKLDMAQSWLNNFGDPYTLSLFDPTGNLGLNLGVYGVPETFIIDKQGKIRYKHIGEINQDIWQSELLPVIKTLS